MGTVVEVCSYDYRVASSFSLQEMSSLPNGHEMLLYADQHLKFLGSGNRHVFSLNSSQVLKIADTRFGQQQNETEAKISSDSKVKEIIAKAFNFDPQNYFWLVAEKVRPLNSADEWARKLGFKQLNISQFKQIAELQNGEALANWVEKRKGLEAGVEFWEDLNKAHSLLKAAHVLVTKHRVAEINIPGHWGITSRGNLVVLDYGY